MVALSTALAQAPGRRQWLPPGTPKPAFRRHHLLLVLLAALLITPHDLRILAFGVLSDAYLTVAVFVAGTLFVIYGFERIAGIDLAGLLARHRAWELPIAAFLGALPGCGGAVVVVTQFVRGHLSFGAVVASLTATMGDAAFLLLAREPVTGLGLAALGFAAGGLTGALVNRVLGPDHLRPTARRKASPSSCRARQQGPVPHASRPEKIWLLLLAPGLTLGLLDAFQVDIDGLFGFLRPLEPRLWIGAAGGLFTLALWSLAADKTTEGGCERSQKSLATRVAGDTAFITLWAAFAFLLFELAVHLSGSDLRSLFSLWAPLVPLAAVLVGFLPGCGPQILVSSLYLTGSLPLSAQIGNAISNDGDALFPALALAPKAALAATLYSAFPALVMAYGTYGLLEVGRSVTAT